MKQALLCILSFLLGSIPFGFLICKFSLGVDIRKLGSGNIGTTNVMRIAGPTIGILVLILDTSKGLVPVLLAKAFSFSPIWVVFAGISAILGHIFSPFIGFRGGRGVATGLGVVIGITPLIALFLFLIWGMVVIVFRYVSLASLISAFAFPLLMTSTNQPLPYLVLSFIISALVIARHKPNLERLFKGQEHKIGRRIKPQ